jgi:uncharacterized protein YdiU (UPF0061 family)
MPPESLINFDNSYARLPTDFYSSQKPERVSQPGLIRVNKSLAIELGLDPLWLESEQGIAFLAGNYLPEGAEPIATVYAGHQFGGYSPRLGDGRAVLIGEIISPLGHRYDIQLKGSGRTPYSRGGDGRAPLGPVLREYIVSEAMAVLGVPTTRALAAVTTGDTVLRETPLPGAVLARVAKSHLRIGTMQYFSARNDSSTLRTLVDYVIDRHYPNSKESPNTVLSMLDSIIQNQAALIAQWQSLGFIHGVMNTDNMLLSGETIDYGPCAFLDQFEPDKTFSSIDHGGRYAYGNQPQIAHWNLSVLTQLLLPLLHDDQNEALVLGQAAIDAFPGYYQTAFLKVMRKKLGLTSEHSDDASLIQQLLTLMKNEKCDYTLTFRSLSDAANPEVSSDSTIAPIFELPDAFNRWLTVWQSRVSAESQTPATRQDLMYKNNPVFIARNHLVEEAIASATQWQDFEPFNQLVDVLARPFSYKPALARYALPPTEEQEVQKTFCGT